MALQDIIDTATNIEINRSKLVAQTVSRSGRISTASRNWANPFRFIVTPKPIWTASEYRAAFAELLDKDRYEPMGFYLNNISQTTGLAILDNSWMINYQGGGDVSSNNNTLDNYGPNTATSGTSIILNYTTGTPVAGSYIVKKGDYVRITLSRYPHIATADVLVPSTATGITGTIQAAGVRVALDSSFNNTTYVTTGTRTAITGMSTTTGLSVGQIITESGTNTGSFGGLTYIESIISSTQINIISTTNCTAGAITFNGSGSTDSPAAVIPIHRGYIGSVGVSQTAVRLGARAAQFVVNVTKLPQVKYLPGQFVELTGDIELIEEIL